MYYGPSNQVIFFLPYPCYISTYIKTEIEKKMKKCLIFTHKGKDENGKGRRSKLANDLCFHSLAYKQSNTNTYLIYDVPTFC